VIKFVSDLQQVGGFPQVFQFPPPIKLLTMKDHTWGLALVLYAMQTLDEHETSWSCNYQFFFSVEIA
jgi:hypothetical protein